MNLSMRDKKILLMFIGILVFFLGGSSDTVHRWRLQVR